MFTLPSLWNMIVSTIVFFIAAYTIRRFLEDQGLPKGATRSLLVFTLAFLVSWGAGELVDLLLGTKPDAETPSDLTQLLNAVVK